MMDLVRYSLLFGTEGVPLGLILSNVRFTDVQYLLSRSFRAGCLGFETKRTALSFVLLLLCCSFVALFIGPSTAILMIPTFSDYWPAGGASFWLNGDLSPSKLDIDTIKNPKCAINKKNLSLLGWPDRSNMSFIGWTGQQPTRSRMDRLGTCFLSMGGIRLSSELLRARKIRRESARVLQLLHFYTGYQLSLDGRRRSGE